MVHTTLGNTLRILIIGLIGMLGTSSFAADVAEGSGEKPTPPVIVDAWDLDQDIAKINQQWSSILAVLETKEYFLIQHDDVSAWSCGQQAGHLALVLSGTADSLDKLLANPDVNADGELSEMGKNLLESGVMERGFGKAPEPFKPGDTNRLDLKKTLLEAKSKWEALFGRKDEIANCKSRSEHPAGMLTASNWVRLMAIHNAHHLKIVRDVLRETDDTDSAFGAELME